MRGADSLRPLIEKSEIAELISTALEVKRITIADIIIDRNTVEFICDGWDKYMAMTIKELRRHAAATIRMNTDYEA